MSYGAGNSFSGGETLV